VSCCGVSRNGQRTGLPAELGRLGATHQRCRQTKRGEQTQQQRTGGGALQAGRLAALRHRHVDLAFAFAVGVAALITFVEVETSKTRAGRPVLLDLALFRIRSLRTARSRR